MSEKYYDKNGKELTDDHFENDMMPDKKVDEPTLSEIGQEQAVANQVREILKANDMAGYLVVAGRQSATFCLMLDPSWMRLQAVDGTDGMSSFRLRSRSEDYANNPDPDAKRKDLQSTMGFLIQAGTMTGEMAMHLLHLHDIFSKTVGAEHTESTFVPFKKR